MEINVEEIKHAAWIRTIHSVQIFSPWHSPSKLGSAHLAYRKFSSTLSEKADSYRSLTYWNNVDGLFALDGMESRRGVTSGFLQW